jgi:hypothetical protein
MTDEMLNYYSAKYNENQTLCYTPHLMIYQYTTQKMFCIFQIRIYRSSYIYTNGQNKPQCPKMDQDQVPPHRPRKAFVVSTYWPSTPSHNLTSQPFCSTLPDPLTLPTQQLCILNVPLQPLRWRWHVPLTQWLSLHDYMVPTTQKTTVISLPHLSPSGLSVMVSELP